MSVAVVSSEEIIGFVAHILAAQTQQARKKKKKQGHGTLRSQCAFWPTLYWAENYNLAGRPVHM